MPAFNDNDLAKTLRGGEIFPVYFLYGKDVASVQSFTKKLTSKLTNKEDNSLNYHYFDGKKLDLGEFADVCEMLPMFAERITVVINDFNCESLSAKDLEFLISTVTNLPETTVVIFYVTGIDVYTAKKTLTAKNKKFADNVAKVGAVCEFNYKNALELSKYITTKVEKNDCSISKKAAEYLANRCLCNTLMINSEIKKLCDYLEGGEITIDVIDDLVTKSLDTSAFTLAKALTRFDAKTSFTLLYELYDCQAECVGILSALSMAFTDLYRARVALNQGIPQNKTIADFGYKGREFAIRNAYNDCGKISVSRLRRCMKILSDTDIALKSLRTDNKILLETAIGKMLIK